MLHHRNRTHRFEEPQQNQIGARPDVLEAAAPRESIRMDLPSELGSTGQRQMTTCSVCTSPMPVDGFCMSCWEVC